ncbi:hypothetical protein [Rhizobium leguminosarum]|uniref:hypothetical protein n=1 Tax=Rhizobium leguminosarum TaxID=384 RepID=UPI0013DC5D05|nr:hypothetical protein [Rhizobium leguminosarum]NEK38645.1 hypothetical protein [Rhizobium leguminosarum]
MQRSLIQPDHAYVSRDPGRPRYVSRIENGIVAYRQCLFGIPFSRTTTLDEFARWAHEDVELRERRDVFEPLRKTA